MHGAAPHQLARNHRLRLLRCLVGGNGLGIGGDFEMSDTQLPKALQLAENVVSSWAHGKPPEWAVQTAAELRRLHRHELANAEWCEKTNWISKGIKVSELGLHRADVLKQRIEHLEAELEQARAALAAQGEPVGEVFTMEALGTPGKPFCHVLLNRTLPTGTKLYTAPPAPAKPMTDAWADGVQDAADLLKRMADEMAMERGEADPDTGAIQFKSAATREWHASLGELAEEIERLKPANPTITDKGCA